MAKNDGKDKAAARERNFAAEIADYIKGMREKNEGMLYLDCRTWRPWHKLSPAGKLGYAAVAAVRNGVSLARFAEGAREVLGGDAASREEVYLRLLLRQERDLQGLAELLPESKHDLLGPDRPLTPLFRELIESSEARMEQMSQALRDVLPKSPPPLAAPRTGAEPPAPEKGKGPRLGR